MEKVRSRGVKFTLAEKKSLEEAYQKGTKIPNLEAKILAESMGMEERQISAWFSRRRRKDDSIPTNRPHFTDEQREKLEIAYQNNNMPKLHVLKELAERLDVQNVRRLSSWFSHKRISERVSNMPVFNQEQKEYLMSIYAKLKYPRGDRLNEIAEELGATTKQIYAWFSAERTKDKNEGRKKPPLKCPSKIPDFNTTATELLEAVFAENPQPTNQELKKIQENTNIDERRLEIWFDIKRRSVNRSILAEKLKCEKDHQKALTEAYQNNKYLSVKELNKLADRIGLKHLRVQHWFRYRRFQDKDFDQDHPVITKQIRIEASARCVLDEAYQKNKYPTQQEMYALADRVGLKKDKVQNWFHKKRYLDKDANNRKRFTADQYRSLQAAFQMNTRPSTKEKETLAMNIGLSLYQVTSWFTSTRVKTGSSHTIVPLTAEQKDVLLGAYRENRFPHPEEFAELANCVGLTEVRVRTWFSTTRKKANKLAMANLLQANQEESDLEDNMAEVKMEEPIDKGLGDAK